MLSISKFYSNELVPFYNGKWLQSCHSNLERILQNTFLQMPSFEQIYKRYILLSANYPIMAWRDIHLNEVVKWFLSNCFFLFDKKISWTWIGASSSRNCKYLMIVKTFQQAFSNIKQVTEVETKLNLFLLVRGEIRKCIELSRP